jgi:Lon protease-like protein
VTPSVPERSGPPSRTLGMFPLAAVLFPMAGLPLHVFEPRYRALMADCLDRDGTFGVVLITRGSEVGGGDQRVDVGTVARIDEVAELDDGRMLVMAHGVHRVRVDRWLADAPYPRAVVEEFPVAPDGPDDLALATAEAAVRRLRSLLSELSDVPALAHDLVLDGDNGEVGWQLCELAPLNLVDRQRLLASVGLQAQLDLLVELCDAMADDVVALLAGGFDD